MIASGDERVSGLRTPLSVLVSATTCQESVVLEVSSGDSGPQSRKICGLIQEFVGQTLTLVSDEEIPTSAKVTTQNKDFIFFGEVLSCVAEPGARWTTKVRIKRRLMVV
jgi:hypothetical protein